MATTERSPRQRVRQRAVEVLASEAMGTDSRTLANWRTFGAVPHRHRVRLAVLGRELLGVELQEGDFTNWRALSAP
jgi:hypothetical protein